MRILATLAALAEIFGALTTISGAAFAVVLWRKLERWMDSVHQEQHQPSWAEGPQWLAERLARDSDHKEAQSAYQRFAGWRPQD